MPHITIRVPTCDVSIVVPVRNEGRRIVACLESILAQEIPGRTLEVLVVDGLSTDDTRETILRTFGKDRRLRLLDNPAGTVAPALNIGLRAARGRVIVRMDAHAVYDSDYVQQCLDVMEQTGANAVGGVQIAVPGARTRIARAIAAVQASRFGTGGGAHRLERYEGPAETLWLGAFDRVVVERVGGFDETLFRSEDNDFYQRVRQAGGRLWVSSRIRGRYICRATLRGYLRQCFVTGTEIPRTIRRNPRAMSLRHLVPGLAILTAIVLAIAAAELWSPWSVVAGNLLAAGAAAYAVLAGAAAVRAATRTTGALLVPVLALFPFSHAAYGLGTLVGLARTEPPAREARPPALEAGSETSNSASESPEVKEHAGSAARS